MSPSDDDCRWAALVRSTNAGNRGLDFSGRRLGAGTEVPRLPGGLPGYWNRSRDFGVERDLPPDAARNPVRGIAVLSCGKTPASFGVDEGVEIWREDLTSPPRNRRRTNSL